MLKYLITYLGTKAWPSPPWTPSTSPWPARKCYRPLLDYDACGQAGPARGIVVFYLMPTWPGW